MAELDARFPGDDVPRPPYWGGYRLVPDAIEFWQGRANRLHDRALFTAASTASWREKLALPVASNQPRGDSGASGTGPRARGAAHRTALASTRWTSGWW